MQRIKNLFPRKWKNHWKSRARFHDMLNDPGETEISNVYNLLWYLMSFNFILCYTIHRSPAYKISTRMKIQITSWIPFMYTHYLYIQQSTNSSIEFCLTFLSKLVLHGLEEKEFCWQARPKPHQQGHQIDAQCDWQSALDSLHEKGLS